MKKLILVIILSLLIYAPTVLAQQSDVYFVKIKYDRGVISIGDVYVKSATIPKDPPI